MKKLLLIIPAAVILLAACNTEKKDRLTTDKNIIFTDTSLLKPANASTDVGANEQQPAVVAEKQETAPKTQVRTITKTVRVKERQPAARPVQKETPPVVAETPVPVGNTNPSTGTAGTGNTGTGDGNVGTAPAEKKKEEGWSQAAKGATIGGVGGAVAGAVIGKGAKGAAIGGIIGAAGGYILGRKADKKSGRVPYSTTDSGIYKKQ
ncbi:MAG: hypothetical protein LH615_11770 [Ferruginibacter sp.]|nr:hypothetical protein [Ferruginibacter sp.]